MNQNINVGVANPFALAQVLSNRQIDWSRIENPLDVLEKTLGTSADQLFSGKAESPLYALSPHADIAVTPKVQAPAVGVTRELALSRMSNIQSKGLSKLDDANFKRLTDLLIPLDPTKRETEYGNASWKDIGDFFEEAAEFSDPLQGTASNCWLIAALASVAATRPYAITQRTRITGPDNNSFVNAVTVDYNGLKTIEVGEQIPVNDATGMPLFGRSAETNEIWPGMYEKVFAKLRSGNTTDKPDITATNFGDPAGCCAQLVPGLTASYLSTSTQTSDQLWQAVRDNSIGNPRKPGNLLRFSFAGRAVNPLTAWTYGNASQAPDAVEYDATTRLVANHAYSVLGWISIGGLTFPSSAQQRYIVLRNPWGMWEGAVDTLQAGNWEAYDQSWWRATPLNTGGVFAMKIETFKRYFAGLGVAK